MPYHERLLIWSRIAGAEVVAQIVVYAHSLWGDVRFGPDFVRFTPNNGHSETPAGLPVLTQPGHCQEFL